MEKKRKMESKAQIGIEYMIIAGFVTFIVIVILGLALAYGGSVKDSIRINHVNNYANKILSTSESVFYSGDPSKATISAYLPEGVSSVELIGEDIIITIQTNSGINKIAYSSSVPIFLSTNLTSDIGLKKIEITAGEDGAYLNQI